VDIKKVRFTLFASVAAVSAALVSLAPVAAQTVPAGATWTAGPDAKGSNTIIGRVEAPTRTQNVAAGASMLVSGWAADTTAQGWAGISGVEVYSGAKDKGGTKLATGTVGLTRTDVADIIGPTFAKSGFSATVPASALSKLTPGAVTLYVYVNTPDKGSYYRTAPFTLGAPLPALEFPNDPIITIARPQEGMNVTQKQFNNRFTIQGFALDRNSPLNPASQTVGLANGLKESLLGPGCNGCANPNVKSAGISQIQVFMDGPKLPNGRPAPGAVNLYAFANNNSGTDACGAGCLYSRVPVSNNGRSTSWISREYGDAFDFAGFSLPVNWLNYEPGSHTLYVYARSAVTGKETVATVPFNLLEMNANGPILPDGAASLGNAPTRGH